MAKGGTPALDVIARTGVAHRVHPYEAPRRQGRDRDRSPQFTSVSRGPGTRLSRMADALARRDFIYVVVVLSAFGKAHWFLVMAAIGLLAIAMAIDCLLFHTAAWRQRMHREASGTPRAPSRR